MTFNEWVIQNFKRKKAVIIYVADESGHLTKHWCIPERDNTVKIQGVPKAVLINRESMRLSTKWNIPTFVVHHTNCEVINLNDQRQSYYNADELRLILDNDEAHKVFSASKGGRLSSDTMIILAVIVIGFLFIGYFFNTKLEAIQSAVNPDPIVEVIPSE